MSLSPLTASFLEGEIEAGEVCSDSSLGSRESLKLLRVTCAVHRLTDWAAQGSRALPVTPVLASTKTVSRLLASLLVN